MATAQDAPLSFGAKSCMFIKSYWRGIVVFLTPTVSIALVVGASQGLPSPAGWCGVILVVMATFWVTEAMPLITTSLIPIFSFPLCGIMDSNTTCQAYVNDTVIMFLGSLFLAYAIELSGLHVRLALCAIRIIGYSHNKMLFALSFMTMFVSMWITNTAATTMMMPIIFAILRVLEQQGLGTLYEYDGDTRVPSRIAVCYFCTAAFSSSIGGLGTLVGTGTNLAFKGLFEASFVGAPSDLLSFPRYSAYAVPIMLVLEICLYFWLIFTYFGFLRPNSLGARQAKLTPEGIAAAKRSVEQQWKNLGPVTYHEACMLLLFALAMVLFFSRWPGVFPGWAQYLTSSMGVPKELQSRFIRDSTPAMLVTYLMFLLPASLGIFKYCTAKYMRELPKGAIMSILDFHRIDSIMPWGFCLLLGGGFALSTGAKVTGLDRMLGESMSAAKALPPSIVMLLLILLSIFITNFASNVAVANVICPIAMKLAVSIKMDPLWMCVVCGMTCSLCFVLPVGTPANLVVQSALGMPTKAMVEAGWGITVITVFVSWAFSLTYFFVIWPSSGFPEWAQK